MDRDSKVLITLSGIFLLLVAILFLPWLSIYFAILFIIGLFIRIKLHFKWPKSKYILFIYSDSEHWAPYIEQNIIPKIQESAIIINRTKQQNWKQEYKAEYKAIAHWAHEDINPIALVFKPYRRVKSFRFYEAFRDYKHGKDSSLHAMCNEFYNYAALT